MGRLDDKVAVITGAASGIGRGTALCLAKEGAAVVAGDLNSQGGERVVGEIAAAGGRALFQHVDVTSEPDIKALVERAVQDYGRLDVVFNNAGLIGAMGPIETINAEDWDKTIAVLLRAVFFGIRYAVEPMRKSGGGSIISTSSVRPFYRRPTEPHIQPLRAGLSASHAPPRLNWGETEFVSIVYAPVQSTLRYLDPILRALSRPWRTFSQSRGLVAQRTSPRWFCTWPAMNRNGLQVRR
jgi:NAD(P)-dependent dehydrogenase (short-subunit alcohol dehydrogenase family)